MPDITLLLVDDEVAFRKLLSKELAHAGYRVDTAAGLLGPERCDVLLRILILRDAGTFLTTRLTRCQ